jgi:hypothetical protein
MSHTKAPRSPAQAARDRLGAATRNGASPDDVDAARRDLAEANLAQHIRRVVAGWPPLTAEQRQRLALLLNDPAETAGTAGT